MDSLTFGENKFKTESENQFEAKIEKKELLVRETMTAKEIQNENTDLMTRFESKSPPMLTQKPTPPSSKQDYCFASAKNNVMSTSNLSPFAIATPI